jgi:hypothetical protein
MIAYNGSDKGKRVAQQLLMAGSSVTSALEQ